MRQYLEPGYYIDSKHPDVIAFAKKHVREIKDPIEQALALYLGVRDGWRYDPHQVDLRPEAMKASAILQRDHGYCGEKATVLAAAARVMGIPSRLGFANVTNHIGTEKLEKRLGTNVLVFHGYTDLYLKGQWVKATPAFNKELCERLGVAVLEFNGREDSIFQEYDKGGGRFMEYLVDHGTFADVPYHQFVQAMLDHYPHLFEAHLPVLKKYMERAPRFPA